MDRSKRPTEQGRREVRRARNEVSAALGLNPQAISNAMLGIRNAQIGMPGLRMKYTFEGFVSAKLASFCNTMVLVPESCFPPEEHRRRRGAAPALRDPRRARAAGHPGLRRRMNNELNFPPNFERLVLGCIDADFCK